MRKVTLIDTIQKQMETDEENRFKQEKHLIKARNNESLDDFLIALCGWSFESIEEINKQDNKEESND